jgi:small subunit ribosomal protein S4
MPASRAPRRPKAFDIGWPIGIRARSERSGQRPGFLSVSLLSPASKAVMTKRSPTKNKICRRLGVNLWGRAKNPIVKRDYPPGEHGSKRRKISGYGQQLAAKQKLKGYYGNITERQFRRLYQEAARRRGDTAEHMVGLLERRLDTIVYRLNFVPTVFAARQFVNHGHVMVNGRRVTIPSYLVREGDVVEVREKSKNLALVLGTIQQPERDVPDYLTVDFKALKGTLVRVPKLADVPYPVLMEPNLVIEYYSR